jgi:hypothetical protein
MAAGRSGLDALRVVMLEALPIDGLSAERVLYPDRVAPGRHVGMLDHVLHSFRAVRPRPVPCAAPPKFPGTSFRHGTRCGSFCQWQSIV